MKMTIDTVTTSYIDGIREGRETFNREGMANAQSHISNLRESIRMFSPQTATGQFVRGELDFWVNQTKR